HAGAARAGGTGAQAGRAEAVVVQSQTNFYPRKGDVMQVQAYLSFDGRCEAAIEFYKKALAAEVTRLLRFKDNPQPTADCKPAAGTENKIMHAALRIGETTVMATDGQMQAHPSFQGFSLALTAINDAQAERLLAA